MSDYSTLLSSVQDEAHEPADTSVFARHTKAALYHLRALVLPWSHATANITLVADQQEYERGVDLPGDILSFDSVFLKYPTVSGGLNVELFRVTHQEMERLDVSTTAAVGIPNYYSWYNDRLSLWPIPGQTDQTLQISYQKDATRDENTGVEFSASNPDNNFTNEFFKRGEELLRSRVLMTYAASRSHSQDEAFRAERMYNMALRSVMRERDAMELEGQQVSSYW